MISVTETHSAAETLEFGRALGLAAHAGSVFALSGELGAGKTVLAKGIALGLGVMDEITSPTFTLMEIYEGRVPFYHFDLYRIESGREMDQLFFEEYWESEGVSVIEWAERAGERVPSSATRITIEYADGDARRICVEHPGT